MAPCGSRSALEGWLRVADDQRAEAPDTTFWRRAAPPGSPRRQCRGVAHIACWQPVTPIPSFGLRVALIAAVLAGCAPTATVVPVGPDGPRLPPVPTMSGTLRVDVVYPPAGATVTAADSTFIFGNVGRGGAQLTINGAPVEVAPNGAWLAFLPVPDDGVYQLAATADGQTVTATHTINVPRPAPPVGPALRIIESSITPTGTLTGVAGERIEVRFRGTPNAVARLRLPDGTSVPLTEQTVIDRAAGFMLDQARTDPTVSEYVGSFELTSTVATTDTAVTPPSLISPIEYSDRLSAQGMEGIVAELARGNETVEAVVPLTLGVLEEGMPRVAVAATTRPDSTVIGRRALGADQAWDFFWPNGTIFAIDGEAAGFYRVRLTRDISAWVAATDVALLPAGTRPPIGSVGPSVQITPRPEWSEVRFSMPVPLPFRIVPSEWGLSVEFYGATGRPMYFGYGVETGFISRAEWDQRTDELFRFDIYLDRPLWGYRYRWDGAYLVLDVRRPPSTDPAAPLRGLRIGVDAGHLGGTADTGAIGPTRLQEVDAALTLARRLSELLRAEGAEVLEIRPDSTVVPLVERPVIASEADVHLLLSLHFNAFPDGVNPFENHGTTMFYYWPHSLEFARSLQDEIQAELGLPDRGVRFQNLAMTRTMWMPAVLTETLFLMFPQQEAALRDPATVNRIAQAHLRAIERFVAERTQLVEATGRR